MPAIILVYGFFQRGNVTPGHLADVGKEMGTFILFVLWFSLGRWGPTLLLDHIKARRVKKKYPVSSNNSRPSINLLPRIIVPL